MFLGLAAEIHGAERVLGAPAGALDHVGPAAIVCIAEFGEQPGQRCGGRFPYLFGQ